MEAGIVNNVLDLSTKETNGDEKLPEIPIAPRKQRERRQKSPNTTSMLLALEDPAIASSSGLSGAAQKADDSTFEPTIDMMVNDFDDEQTLNEEEALAASEQQDPQDEIATLREESEMPLEELLAKYQFMSHSPLPKPQVAARKKKKKHAKKAIKENDEITKTTTSSSTTISTETNDTVESAGEDVDEELDEALDLTDTTINGELHVAKEQQQQQQQQQHEPQEVVVFVTETVPKQSYLFDLYPDQTFNTATKPIENNVVPLEALYGDDVESESEEELEVDPDFAKKTIMVGLAYQASIPVGLSQYGDVLPYENEDKLIWEPSQVSEREVEEYLLMARDIKPTLCEDEATGGEVKNNEADVNNVSNNTSNGENASASAEISTKSFNGTVDHEPGSVVKDNEQALHLLVQCGYDFKEALRRKRLNAVPLTGSMSIWSEEECQKFEEGIQKFGKDFLRIRQNQVRTRSMRELVLFYYLWKKSERRDHEFANADTVDHMDIYLNESTANSAVGGGCQTTGNSAQILPNTNSRARSNSTGNISIMAVSQSNHVAILTSPNKTSANRKRAGTTGNNVNQFHTTGIIAATFQSIDNEAQ